MSEKDLQEKRNKKREERLEKKQMRKASRQEREQEKFENEVEIQKRAIKGKKWTFWTVLLEILLFPFRFVEFIFKTIYGTLNILLIVFVVAVFAGCLIFAKVYPMYQEASTTAYEKLASIKDSNFRMLQNTRLYDKDGNVLGEIDAGDYHYVDITEVSDHIQKGYISIEDKRFMQHIGIDLQSLARAGLSLFRHNGEITQGGSTITQQVIKNNVLSQEQTFSRKLVEVLIAPKLEQMYPKSKIMEFYVNTNYYGNGCYGVETASKYYFGKSCKDLSLAEAAMLCGVSNSPNKYNPVASMKYATQKKEQVLECMLKEGYITDKQYKKALKKKIKVKASLDEYDNDNYMISYALYSAALELMREDGFEFKYYFSNSKEESEYKKKYQEAYTEKASLIRAGGYTIYTSFDQKLQEKLQKSIDNQLKGYTDKQDNGKFAMQGAAVCVDNETGYIVAMVGGRGDKDEFNRAFLSKRQPGSSIKPLLVYAPAINEGVLVPSTIYTDKKVYANPSDLKSYSPSNSGGGFRGNMTVREALARSINTIAYQIYRDTGFKRAMNYLDKMHFTTLTYADTTAQSLCLGGFTDGVRVVDLAKGYATLPMGGQYSDRTCLVKIDHEIDGTIFNEKSLATTEKKVFSEDTAFMMCDMMQGTLEEDYGTAKSIRNANMIAGGKTGTTSSNKDVWFSGFTKYYTCSVWVGYDTPKTMYGQYGGGMPAKIWSNFMTSIKKNMTKADFKKPSTISLRTCSNGNYSGDNIKLEYKSGKDRYYNLRTNGAEWYSNLNELAIKTLAKEKEFERAYSVAEDEVKSFLKHKINSVDDALNLDTRYSYVVSSLDSVGDDYKTAELRRKSAQHYTELSNVITSDWQTYIAEYQESEKELEEAKRVEAVEDSKLTASNQLKQNRLYKADWYINELNKRQFNTDVTKLLIEDAIKAVERLKGYPEYDDYNTRLENAKSRVNGLPTEIIMPEIPKDYEDDTYLNPNDYNDEEVNEYNQAVEEVKRFEAQKKLEAQKKKEEEKKKKEEEKNKNKKPSKPVIEEEEVDDEETEDLGEETEELEE